MEELRWWSRLMLVSAIVALLLLLAGPLGYKFEISPLQQSLVSLLIALVISILVFVVALVMAVVSNSKGLTRNRNLVLISLALSLVPLVIMVPQMAKGTSVPPIHDITTDTADPPAFFAAVPLRINAPNDLVYGMEQIPPEEMARMQAAAYPNVKPLQSSLTVDAAVARAAEVLSDQGLEVINIDPPAGIVEAVATTFWFGFKDDLVVRVRPSGAGSVIDVRSVSRVGQSDVGANAARIERFLAAFQD